jgi:hypothetical protein
MLTSAEYKQNRYATLNREMQPEYERQRTWGASRPTMRRDASTDVTQPRVFGSGVCWLRQSRSHSRLSDARADARVEGGFIGVRGLKRRDSSPVTTQRADGAG